MRRAVKEDASYADGIEIRSVGLSLNSQPPCLPPNSGVWILKFELLSCLGLGERPNAAFWRTESPGPKRCVLEKAVYCFAWVGSRKRTESKNG